MLVASFIQEVVPRFDRVAHPLHAIAVPDLQLLLGPLEATVLLVVGRGLKVDVHIVGGLRGRGHGCEFRKQTVRARGCKLTTGQIDMHSDGEDRPIQPDTARHKDLDRL